MNFKHSLVYNIKTKQLIWYDTYRWSDDRLPKQILARSPRDSWKKGTLRRSWWDAMNSKMKERNLPDKLWMTGNNGDLDSEDIVGCYKPNYYYV